MPFDCVDAGVFGDDVTSPSKRGAAVPEQELVEAMGGMRVQPGQRLNDENA